MEESSAPPPGKSHASAAVAVVVIIVVLILATFVFFGNFSLPLNLIGLNGRSTTLISTENPQIGNGSISISYPSDYQTLSNYALNLINTDRSGLSPVIASPIPSAQQHADSMLFANYFSHWDTQGFKPYMRYTLLNGTGFVDENVAFEESFGTFTSTQRVESAIGTLEYQMMNNDSQCCQNGHRNNILSPYHNRVSIGIAYDSSHVYFVEDFENYYTELQSPILSSSGNIVLNGSTTESLSPTAVLVFFDQMPTSLSAATLNSQYNGPYNQGTFTGGAFPPCNGLNCEQFRSQDCPHGCISIQSTTWKVSSNSMDIEFPLGSFVQAYGSGVYTVYAEQGNQSSPEFLTSLSVFVSH